MSLLSILLCMLTLMAFSSFLPCCCAWQTPSTLSLLLSHKLTHRHFRGQASSRVVPLNYRAGGGGGGGGAGDGGEVGEGAYYDRSTTNTMDQVFTGYQQHYDPLVGGNHLGVTVNDDNQGRKSRPNNGMNSFGPDAWESSSSSSSSSSTRRDHVTIGPGSANSHAQSRHRPSTFSPTKSTFARQPHQQYGNDHNHLHHHHHRRHVSADDHLPQDSFRHQDSANLGGDRRPFNQQQQQPYTSWSPRAPSHMSFFDHVHREGQGEMLPDHRHSRIDRSDTRTSSPRWNPRRQAKSFRLGRSGGGLSGPISSQAFQEGMDTHTTLGPLPDHDVRRRFLLEARQQRAQKQAQEDWVGGFDGRGNVLWNHAQQQQQQYHHRRHHDLDEKDEYFRQQQQQQHHGQRVAVPRGEDSSYFGHEMEHRRGYYY